MSWEQVKEMQSATTKLLQDFDLHFARNQYEAANGTGDAAHPPKWYLEQVRQPSATTARNYLGRGRSLCLEALATGRDVWSCLEDRCGSSGSWYTGKAALQHYLRSTIRESKRTIDRMFEPNADRTQRRRALMYLPLLADALAHVPIGLPSKFRRGSGFKQVRMSKSHSARRVPADWREKVAAIMLPKYQPHWLVQCATGCRPQELANGFTVLLRHDGLLQISILGAKFGKHSGQHKRELLLSAQENGVVRMLASLLPPGKQIATKLSGSADAYRQSVARRCRKLFPDAAPQMLPSAYTARHQRKADWKRSGVSRIELAKLLGHRTTRSAVYYGAGVRGRSGTVKPAAVRATSEVKVRPAFRAPSINNASAAKPKKKRKVSTR